MLKRVEIEVDDDLIQKVIRRYRVKGAREAVNLALRTLLGEADTAEHGHDDEYDEFSDPNASQCLGSAAEPRHRVIPSNLGRLGP